MNQKDEGTQDDQGRHDQLTNFIFRIKEHEARLILHYHDDDNNDDDEETLHNLTVLLLFLHAL
jgi:hypothetical protein